MRAIDVAVRGTMKRLASAYDSVRPPDQGLVVLAYHRVGARTKQEVNLDPEIFADQMRWLAGNRTVVDLDAAIDRLADVDGEAATAVSFDDGTADFIEHALPALVAAGVPSTYYVATDFIESQRPFPNDGTPMSWAGLAEAVSTGLVIVGSHTHTHAVMDKVTPEQAESELRRSIELIEDRLGQPVRHFAYPKGVAPRPGPVEAVVAKHFRSAAVANCGVNCFGATNPMRLERTPVQRSDQADQFCSKAVGGMRLEGQLRSALNRRRYRAATY